MNVEEVIGSQLDVICSSGKEFLCPCSKFCEKCQIKWQDNDEEQEVSRWFLSFKQEFAFKYVHTS